MGLSDAKIWARIARDNLTKEMSYDKVITIHNELLNLYGALIILLFGLVLDIWLVKFLGSIQSAIALISFFRTSWRAIYPE